MAWSFNFCAGFLPNDPSFNTNRYIIIAFLATEMCVFVLLRLIASCCYKGRAATFDEEGSQVQNSLHQVNNESDSHFNEKYNHEKSSEGPLEKSASNESTLNNSSPPGSSQLVSRRKNIKTKCTKFFQNINIDEFQRMFSLYFGHHAVCVGVCMMYCPYFPVTIMCLLYLFAGVLLFYFCHSKYSKPIAWIWGFACFLNMVLFFGSATFVGLANYNIEEGECYGSLIEI